MCDSFNQLVICSGSKVDWKVFSVQGLFSLEAHGGQCDKKKGQPRGRLCFLRKQPQDSLLFQSHFCSFSFTLFPFFSLSGSLYNSLPHTWTEHDGGDHVCFSDGAWEGALTIPAVQWKRIGDELLTSTNHLCRVSTLNRNGNWSEIQQVNVRNHMMGAWMDKVKGKIYNTLINNFIIDLWCTVQFGAPALA